MRGVVSGNKVCRPLPPATNYVTSRVVHLRCLYHTKENRSTKWPIHIFCVYTSMLEVSTLNCGVIVQLPPRILVGKGDGIFVHFPAPRCRQPQSCPTKERVCMICMGCGRLARWSMRGHLPRAYFPYPLPRLAEKGGRGIPPVDHFSMVNLRIVHKCITNQIGQRVLKSIG